MNRLTCALTVAAVMCLAAASAQAGDLVLRLEGGKVYLVAHDVTARQILAEWARLGHTLVVNGDKVAGPPLTLELAWIPERVALDSILRSVSGYMAASRAPGSQGASIYDRILIMPASGGAAPPQMPAASAAPQPFAAPQMPGMEQGTELDEVADDGSEDPANFVNPNAPDAFPQPFNPRTNPGGPFAPQFPGANSQPTNINIPALVPPPSEGQTPTNPWGIQGGSSVPGVISQPQQPTNQGESGRPPY